MKTQNDIYTALRNRGYDLTTIRAIMPLLAGGVEPNQDEVMISSAPILDLTAAPTVINPGKRDSIVVPGYLKADSGFVFGRKSETELVGVLPKLVELARMALKHSPQDFTLYDGLRTPAEQHNNVARGVSKTMASKHLAQSDGFSHAFDAVPINEKGQPVWDWKRIYPIVAAVDFAATQLGIANHIRWGGAWDRVLSDFGGDPEQYLKECQAYQQRHSGSDFIDGPHFEWRP